MQQEILQKKLLPLTDYSQHSRVHLLNGFSEKWFVKRDDELSFGVSGSKMRKYLSLIPSLKKEKIQEAVLLGGASSNNIVGLSQLLIEEGIQPTLFLCGRKPKTAYGNLLLSYLLVKSEHIHWHEKKCWPILSKLAEEYAKNRKACCVIPEGASCMQALRGALTLPLDIIENEKRLGASFDHIICDAGTGMTASSLILGNSFLERSLQHHVVLVAGSEESFLSSQLQWKEEIEKLVGKKIKTLCQTVFYKPSSAPSFGSINASVKKEISKIAREEGILSDPIYSAKLFAEARKMKLKGRVLLIHSGGALGPLMGQNIFYK